MKTLLLLIEQRFQRDMNAVDEVSKYGIALFNHFCDHSQSVGIYKFKLLPSPVRTALFVGTRSQSLLVKNTLNISLHRITTLFTNLEHLSLCGLDLHAMSDAQVYVDDILNQIASVQKTPHALSSLRKITLHSEKQKNREEHSALRMIVIRNKAAYRTYWWEINYNLTLECSHALIFTKIPNIKLNTTKKDDIASASYDNKDPNSDEMPQTQNIMDEAKRQDGQEGGALDDDEKHPTKWNVEEAIAWICSLENGKYERYKPNLIARECAGDDFEYLNDDELCRYEVFKPSHRREILRAIRDLLSKYNDVCRDVANYRDVLGGNYNYKFMTSVEMKGNEGWTMNKSDVESYVINECLAELIRGTPKEQYDALLVAFSGHGTIDSIVCSDSKMIKHSTIRGWFESQNAFKTIPRFFCIDACRVTVKESKQDDEEIEDMKKDSGKQSKKRKKEIEPMKQKPSITVMGHTEGHTVAGGKVSKYLCKQWNAEFEANKSNPQPMYKPFGVLYEAAFEQVLIETPQKLTAAEYDRRIDRVVFVPKDRNRGAEDNAQVDGTAPVIDDDLRNVLIPQEHAPMNLLPHFFTLFNSGYRDNRSLAALTKSKLNQLGITMPFQQKELLRRVSRLTQ
eukprot:219910_1